MQVDPVDPSHDQDVLLSYGQHNQGWVINDRLRDMMTAVSVTKENFIRGF